MNVSQVLEEKGHSVYSIAPEESITQACAEMIDLGVGALLVVNKRDEVIGIITERDVAKAIYHYGADAVYRQVRIIMTEDVVWATPDTTIAEAREMMRQGHFTHLPVREEGFHACGVVSATDILGAYADWMERIQQHEREVPISFN